MIPPLPNCPLGNGNIDKISPDWIRKLLACVKYSMHHPAADDVTIRNHGEYFSVIREAKRIGAGGEVLPYSGLFGVTANEAGSLTVGAGFLLRNGEFIAINETVVALPEKSAILCLCSKISASIWTPPVFQFVEPAADAYPIAEITVTSDGVTIRQYPVTVAVIILTKHCPLAEGVQNG